MTGYKRRQKYLMTITGVLAAVLILIAGADRVMGSGDDCGVLLSPYQTFNYDIYDGADPSNYFLMMGIPYTEGLVHTSLAWGTSASFNLDQRFDLVTFEVGHIDGGTKSGHKLRILLDGEEYMSIDLKRSMMTTEVRINTKGVSVLTLKENDFDQASFGIANVRGYVQMPSWYDKYEEFLPPEGLPASAGTCRPGLNGGELLTPYQTYNLDVLDGSDPRKSFLMTGKEFTYGLEHIAYEWGTSAFFNLGKQYAMVELQVGHIDNEGSGSHDLKVFLDGEVDQTIKLTPDMPVQTLQINTEGITQLILSESDGNQTMYGFANITGHPAE